MKEGSRPVIDMIHAKRMNKIKVAADTIKQYIKGKLSSNEAEVVIGRYKISQNLRKYLKGFVYVAKREWAI